METTLVQVGGVAQRIINFGRWVKQVTKAVGQAIDEQDSEREILLENLDGTVRTVTIFRETEAGYLCHEFDLLKWSALCGGETFFLPKTDQRIRSVHRRSGK